MTAEEGKGAVIITGASRGIGAAIAEKVAEDGYGVLVNYATDADGAQSVVSTIRARGGRAVAVRADVATPGDIADMFERAQQKLGPLAALINNAGIVGTKARIDEQDADELTRLVQVNIVAPCYAPSMPCKRCRPRTAAPADRSSTSPRSPPEPAACQGSRPTRRRKALW
jgi:NAD(P)-dependent dehydrogenase (short-subunit alcohol dehydrogenase family)